MSSFLRKFAIPVPFFITLVLHEYLELYRPLESSNKSGPETLVFVVFRDFGAHQTRGGSAKQGGLHTDRGEHVWCSSHHVTNVSTQRSLLLRTTLDHPGVLDIALPRESEHRKTFRNERFSTSPSPVCQEQLTTPKSVCKRANLRFEEKSTRIAHFRKFGYVLK